VKPHFNTDASNRFVYGSVKQKSLILIPDSKYTTMKVESYSVQFWLSYCLWYSFTAKTKPLLQDPLHYRHTTMYTGKIFFLNYISLWAMYLVTHQCFGTSRYF